MNLKPTHRIAADVGALYFTRVPCKNGSDCHYDPEVLAKGTLVYEVVDSDYDEAPGTWIDTIDGRYLLAASRADYLEELS